MTTPLDLTVLRSRSGGEPLFSVCVDGNVAYAAGGQYDAQLWHTSTWRTFARLTTPAGHGLRRILADGDRLLLAGEYGQILVSADGGESWIDRCPGEYAGCIQFAGIVLGRVLVLGEDGFALDLGTADDDGWCTAEPRPVPELEALGRTCSAATERGGSAYLTTYDGSVVRWRPGETREVSGVHDAPLCGIATTPAGRLVVCGDAGFLAWSDDGETWVPSRARTRGDLEAVAVLDDGRLVAVGAHGQAHVSDDGAESFVALDTGADTHWFAVAPLADDDGGAGAILVGDDAAIGWLGAGPAPWAERPDVLDRSRPLDALFDAGVDGFVGERLWQVMVEAFDADEYEQAAEALSRYRASFEDVYGAPAPPELASLWGVDARTHWVELDEFAVDSGGFAPVGANLMVALAEGTSEWCLGEDLTAAFAGAVRFARLSGGDSFMLAYRFAGDAADATDPRAPGRRAVYSYDHETDAIRGAAADSLDAQAYVAALSSLDDDDLSSGARARAWAALDGRIAPTYRGMYELPADHRPYEIEPGADLVKRSEIRAEWIQRLLAGWDIDAAFAVRRSGDPDVTLAHEPADPDLLRGIEHVVPVALYHLWRAVMLGEDRLPALVAAGRRSASCLIRDTAELVDEVAAGTRQQLGRIEDVPAWLAAIRAAAVVYEAQTAGLARAEQAEAIEGAGVSVEDPHAIALHRALALAPGEARADAVAEVFAHAIDATALWGVLRESEEYGAQASDVCALTGLPDAEQECTATDLGSVLAPELLAALLGTLVGWDRHETAPVASDMTGRIVGAGARAGRVTAAGLAALVGEADRLREPAWYWVHAAALVHDGAGSAALLDHVVRALRREIFEDGYHDAAEFGDVCRYAGRFADAGAVRALAELAARYVPDFPVTTGDRPALANAWVDAVRRLDAGPVHEQAVEVVLALGFAALRENEDVLAVADLAALGRVWALAPDACDEEELAGLRAELDDDEDGATARVLAWDALFGPDAAGFLAALAEPEYDERYFARRAASAIAVLGARAELGRELDDACAGAIAHCAQYTEDTVRIPARQLAARLGIDVGPGVVVTALSGPAVPADEAIARLDAEGVIGRHHLCDAAVARDDDRVLTWALATADGYARRQVAGEQFRLPWHELSAYLAALRALAHWHERLTDGQLEPLRVALAGDWFDLVWELADHVPLDPRLEPAMQKCARWDGGVGTKAAAWLGALT